MLLRCARPLGGLVVLSLIVSAAAADTHPQSDEDACRPDVFRLCMAQIPDEDAIVACLNGAVPQLSPACRAVIAPESIGSVGRKRRTR